MTRAATLMSLCWLLSRTLVGIQGIAGVPPDALQQLAGAEAKWAINKPAAYEFRVEPACNDLIGPNLPEFRQPLIRVSGGPNTRDVHRTGWAAKYDTVEKQFQFIRTAWNSKPLGMRAEYDQRHGYPIRVCVDPSLVTDDEFGFVVTDFRVIPDARPSS